MTRLAWLMFVEPDDPPPIDTGPYAELIEPLAIVLHSFDSYAIEAGQLWQEAVDGGRGGAFLYMAECVLADLGPRIEQIRERHTGECWAPEVKGEPCPSR